MEHAAEKSKQADHKSLTPPLAAGARPAAPAAHPMLALQQQAGNAAVSGWLRSAPRESALRSSSRPLAVTTDGQTTLSSSALSHSSYPEILTHEAVHRAQFHASNKPLGSVPQLERDARDGSQSLLSGHSHSPSFRAPRGLALNWTPVADAATDAGVSTDDLGPTVESNVSSVKTAVSAGDSGTSAKANVQSAGSPGQIQTTNLHFDVAGQGENGSVISNTDLNFYFDPGDHSAKADFSPAEIGVPKDNDPLQVYPANLSYTRTLKIKDKAGRDCTVEIHGTINFSRASIMSATQFKRLTFPELMRLSGEASSLYISIHGVGLIQNYASFESFSGGQGASLNALSEQAAAFLAYPGTGLDGGPKVFATFVEPELTAGEQYRSLEAFLEGADTAEMSRRVMADLKSLQGGTVVSGKITPKPPETGDQDGGLSGLLGAALKGIGLGLLIVGAIFGVSEFFGVSIALASAVVFGTIAATAFVNSLINRYKEGLAAGNTNPISIFSAAVLDATSLSAIPEAITNKSLLTGRDLHLSGQERVAMGVTGAIGLFFTALGIKGLAGPEVPGIKEPIDPNLSGDPDLVPEPDNVADTEGPADTPAQLSKGAALAKSRGYPDAEQGYHWTELNGEPVYRRNPLRGPRKGPLRPERYYDPNTGQFEDVQYEPEPADGMETTAQKGKFGEIKADAHMQKEGFVKRGSHDAPGPGGGTPKPQGIDGVYENLSPPPKWVVMEAKYGDAGYGMTADGKQMSEPWVDNRLNDTVGKTMADQIRLDKYERWELRVDAQGNVTQKVIKW